MGSAVPHCGVAVFHVVVCNHVALWLDKNACRCRQSGAGAARARVTLVSIACACCLALAAVV